MFISTMSVSDIIKFVFTLINFGVTIGLVFYLYRRYGKSMIEGLMQAREQELTLLVEQKQALQEEQIHLDHLIQDEQRFAALLLEKANHWRSQYQKEAAHARQEQQAIDAHLQKRRSRQAQLHTQHRLYDTIMPQVMDKTRTKLSAQFADSQKESEYLNDIITFMQKSDR